MKICSGYYLCSSEQWCLFSSASSNNFPLLLVFSIYLGCTLVWFLYVYSALGWLSFLGCGYIFFIRFGNNLAVISSIFFSIFSSLISPPGTAWYCLMGLWCSVHFFFLLLFLSVLQMGCLYCLSSSSLIFSSVASNLSILIQRIVYLFHLFFSITRRSIWVFFVVFISLLPMLLFSIICHHLSDFCIHSVDYFFPSWSWTLFYCLFPCLIGYWLL